MVASSPPWSRPATRVALLGCAAWFFGNLYEAVVFSPNWVVDSAAQLRRMNELFVYTSPTHYFVPLLPLATILVWVLLAANRGAAAARALRRAAVAALFAALVNGWVVATVIPTLFGAARSVDGAELAAAAWRWNGLNVVRMALVAATMGYLFQALSALDRDGVPDAARTASRS